VALPQSVEVHTHNGVPRSTWFRAIPRVSTWHRPYAMLLVILDLAATGLASLTAIAIFEQAASGSRPVRRSSSRSSRTSACRSGG
jgi:hypothetical protein